MVKQRNEIDEQYQWDLSTIFATDRLGRRSYSLAADIKAASHYAGHLLDSAQTLLDTTNAYLNWAVVWKVYVYAHMKMHHIHEWLNTRVPIKRDVSFIAYCETYFYEPPPWPLLMSNTKSLWVRFQPLEQYGLLFWLFARRKRTCLVSKEEELLAGAGRRSLVAGGETLEILNYADIVFPTVHDDKGEAVPPTHGNYISLVESKDQMFRLQRSY